MNGIKPNNILGIFRNPPPRLFGFVAIGVLAGLAGFGVTYGAQADWMPDANPPNPPIETEAPHAAPVVPPISNSPQTRTIYRVDLRCQILEPQTIELDVAVTPGDRQATIQAEIEAAIGAVLKQWTGSDGEIAGYRVTVRDRVATIDLRRDPNAARPWIGLSTCEQFALFGSLRATIVNESAWGVDRVEFLSLGQALTF